MAPDANIILEITWEYNHHVSTSSVVITGGSQTSSFVASVPHALWGTDAMLPASRSDASYGTLFQMRNRLLTSPVRRNLAGSKQRRKQKLVATLPAVSAAKKSSLCNELFIRCAPGKQYDVQMGMCVYPVRVVEGGGAPSYVFDWNANTFISFIINLLIVLCMASIVITVVATFCRASLAMVFGRSARTSTETIQTSVVVVDRRQEKDEEQQQQQQCNLPHAPIYGSRSPLAIAAANSARSRSGHQHSHRNMD
jgi:hypothetical protein